MPLNNLRFLNHLRAIAFMYTVFSGIAVFSNTSSRTPEQKFQDFVDRDADSVHQIYYKDGKEYHPDPIFMTGKKK